MPVSLNAVRQGCALVLTLTDPATRNALSREVYSQGVEQLLVAAADPAIRVVILQGAEGHFCSGGNLQRIAGVRAKGDAGRVEQADNIDAFGRWIEAMRLCPKPVITAVEGNAAGGGCSLALAGDWVVAAEDARFILSYGRIGLSPDGGGSWQIARGLPRSLALRALWLAEPMPAPLLQQHGLVTELTPKGQALDRALALAEQLGAMAPNALASAKALLREAETASFAAQLASERHHFVQNLFHGNAAEGLAAFQEKRAPVFKA